MSIEDALHAEYVGFLQKAERERRWSVFEDLPWDAPSASVSPDTIRFVHALAGAKGALVFAMNGASPIAERCEAAIDFRAAWQFEESRHRLALADWLKRAGGAGATPPEATPPDS
ncbi:MAG TPA: hypothetical protein VL400_15940, partial [Polyangiaceae bacterium]|nr:hypothetical protein [Polyangiaceae bacterium]